MMRRQQDQQSHKLLYEISNLILNILKSPTTPAPAFEFSDQFPSPTPVRQLQEQITPAGFASLLLGISIALMLCGSVTFFIGFFMMPWILGLVMVLYVVGVVSTLSMIGKAIVCCPLMMMMSCSSSEQQQSPRKDHVQYSANKTWYLSWRRVDGMLVIYSVSKPRAVEYFSSVMKKKWKLYISESRF